MRLRCGPATGSLTRGTRGAAALPSLAQLPLGTEGAPGKKAPPPPDEPEEGFGKTLPVETNELIEEICRMTRRANNIETVCKVLDEHGRTALMMACASVDVPLIETILKKGPDVSLRNNDGLTAYEIAMTMNPHRTVVQKTTVRRIQVRLEEEQRRQEAAAES